MHPSRRTHAPTLVAVAFRTAHLHSGPISRAKLRCACDAPIIARGLFDVFGPPKIWAGVGPRRALKFCHSFWLGRPRRRRPKRRRRSAPTPDVLRLHRNASDTYSCGTPHCVDSRLLFHARMRCRRRRPWRRRSRRPRRRRQTRLRLRCVTRRAGTGRREFRLSAAQAMHCGSKRANAQSHISRCVTDHGG